MTTTEPSRSDYAVPTGEFVQEWLEEHDMSQAQFAARLGISGKHVSLLIRGIAPLSHEVALRLERVTGIEARIWNRQESLYREDLARLNSASILRDQIQRLRDFPLDTEPGPNEEKMTMKRRLDRLWTARIEVGPAFFFFATFNWVNWIAVDHAGEAIRDQRLLVGFLWFAAAMVLFCFAGLTAFSSIRRLNQPREDPS